MINDDIMHNAITVGDIIAKLSTLDPKMKVVKNERGDNYFVAYPVKILPQVLCSEKAKCGLKYLRLYEDKENKSDQVLVL